MQITLGQQYNVGDNSVLTVLQGQLLIVPHLEVVVGGLPGGGQDIGLAGLQVADDL